MRIRKLLGGSIDQDVVINVTQETLSIKLLSNSVKKENIINLDLAKLKKMKSWGDCSDFVIITTASSFIIGNLDAFIYSSKDELASNLLPIRKEIHLHVPFAESNFLDMGLDIRVGNDVKVTSNIPVLELKTTDRIASNGLMPQLLIEGPDEIVEEGEAEYTVSVIYKEINEYNPPIKEFYAYLDSTAGYLPKRVIKVNRTGKFKVKALYLSEGDEIKLKAGFRFHPSSGTKIVKVISK